MTEQDPKRWLDSDAQGDGALRDLLDAGRAERPSAAQLGALAKRLGPPFDGPGSGGGGGGGTTSGVPAAAASGLTTVGVAAAAILVLCGLWAWQSRSENEASAHAQRRAPIEAGRVEPRPPPPAAAAEPAQAPEPQLVTPQAVPPGVVPGPRREPVHAPAAKRAQRPALAPNDAGAELELIERANRQLRDAPAQALVTIAEHEQRFPASQFAQERELIAIEALIATGQREPARVRGERFLARYPASSHARKVRALIATAAPPAAADAAVKP
jgi:hypothetical protein